MTDPQKALWQASRLRTLVAIGRARLQARAAACPINSPQPEILNMTPTDPEPTEEVRSLAADLLQRIALNASGAPFDDSDPETWDEADASQPELVSLGKTRFRIVDADAVDLAVAVGAIEPGDPVLCLRVEFDVAEGTAAPAIGQVVVVPTEEPDVKVMFGIWATHADLHAASEAAPDFGPDAVRNPALDSLAPNQALLVQVIDSEGDHDQD